MNIYYFGADKPWHDLLKTGFRRRNTCILKALVESNLTDEVFVIRKVSRGEFVKSFFKGKSKSQEKAKDIIFASFIPEFFLSIPLLSSINRQINAYQIRRVSGSRKSDDIIWAYWPQAHHVAKGSGLAGTLVFDADHNIIDNPYIADAARVEQQKLLLTIGNSADFILSSVRSMIDWYRCHGIDKGYRLRNGIDLNRFSVDHTKESDSPFTVGYCGTLSKWIDYKILADLAKRNQHWRFVVIGKPYLTDDWEQLKEIKNVELLGDKSATEVVKIMPTFHAALNLYKPHPALDVDSMKLYEYIASGVPVVSTRFHSHLQEDFHGILYIGDTLEQVENHLRTIEKQSGVLFNENIKQFLQQASWHNRVSDFLRVISNTRKQ